MKWAAPLAALVLCGCPHRNAVTTREVVGPDGKTMHETECSGPRRTFGDCMNEAARVCNGPYEVVEKTSEAGDSRGSATMIGNTTFARSSASTNREMLFRCKTGSDTGEGLSTEAEEAVGVPVGDGSSGSRCNQTEDCLGSLRCLEHECN